jgi:hypothetical protein
MSFALSSKLQCTPKTKKMLKEANNEMEKFLNSSLLVQDNPCLPTTQTFQQWQTYFLMSMT